MLHAHDSYHPAYLACEGLTGIGVVTIVGVFSWTDTTFSITSNRAFC